MPSLKNLELPLACLSTAKAGFSLPEDLPCPGFAPTLQIPQYVKSDDSLELGYGHFGFLTLWVG